MTLRVLIACERSQEVCKAFRALGHEAFSNDIEDSYGGHPEWHIKGDAVEAINAGAPKAWYWDIVIAHPPCTYIANSGVRWLYFKDGSKNISRWESLDKAVDFFNSIRNACLRKGVPHAIENPIPHKYAVELDEKGNDGIGQYTQLIQPWQFGHGETKATCLWLYSLPKLQPTNIVDGREQRIWKLPPGPERATIRSKTYEGIAAAMASQWSEYLMNKKSKAA